MGSNIPPLFLKRMIDDMKALKIVFSVFIVMYTVRICKGIVMAVEKTEDYWSIYFVPLILILKVIMTSGILISVFMRANSSNGNIEDYENSKWDPNNKIDSSFEAKVDDDDDENYLNHGDLLTQLSGNVLTHATNPYVENHSQSLGVFSKFSSSPAFMSGFVGIGGSSNESVSHQINKK
jgi:hypothetical protein